MCDYEVKHYWDEESAEVTVEPSWITSSNGITAKQKKIKDIVKVNFLDRYIYLSKNKPSQEKFDKYLFIYKYKIKKDPYPGRDRMVTDITICIKEDINYSKYIGIFLVVLLLSIASYFFISVQKNHKDDIVLTKKVEKVDIKNKKIIVDTVEIAKPIKTKLDILREEVCAKSNFNVNLPDKCWQFFVQDKCNKKTNDSYDLWLKKNKDSMNCIGVKSLKKDKDFRSFFKKQTRNKSIKTFMGDEK